MSRSTATNKRRCAVLFGIPLLCIGVTLICLKFWILRLILPSFILRPGTVLEEYWRKPPMKIAANVYLFNWTNPEEIRNLSSKPKLEQLGPYRFFKSPEKINVTWNDNNTVTYYQTDTWRFDDDLSNGNLSDQVTTFHFLNMYLAYKFRYWNSITKTLIASVSSSQLHTTRTVKQLLYDGYDETMQDIGQYVGFMMPDMPEYEHSGILSSRNRSLTYEKTYNIENGINGGFEVRNWNYNNRTPFFEGSCARVHGSAGELNSPKDTKDYLDFFLGNICRHVQLEYEEDVSVNGILGYKYSVGNRILDNGTLFPENRCYCPGDCLPSGMINVTECFFGMPFSLSLPNFYGADPIYVKSVEGLKPEKEKHETYVVVEPKTGLPLKATIRAQTNALLQPVENMALFQDVPKIQIPMMWLEMEVVIPDGLLTLLKTFLYIPFLYDVASATLVVVGLCLLLFGTIRTMREKLSGTKPQKLQTLSIIMEEERPLCCKNIPDIKS